MRPSPGIRFRNAGLVTTRPAPDGGPPDDQSTRHGPQGHQRMDQRLWASLRELAERRPQDDREPRCRPRPPGDRPSRGPGRPDEDRMGPLAAVSLYRSPAATHAHPDLPLSGDGSASRHRPRDTTRARPESQAHRLGSLALFSDGRETIPPCYEHIQGEGTEGLSGGPAPPSPPLDTFVPCRIVQGPVVRHLPGGEALARPSRKHRAEGNDQGNGQRGAG